MKPTLTPLVSTSFLIFFPIPLYPWMHTLPPPPPKKKKKKNEEHTYSPSFATICDLFFYSFISMNAHTKKKKAPTYITSYAIICDLFSIPLYPWTHTRKKKSPHLHHKLRHHLWSFFYSFISMNTHIKPMQRALTVLVLPCFASSSSFSFSMKGMR